MFIVGAFHETPTITICNNLFRLLQDMVYGIWQIMNLLHDIRMM